VAVGATKISQRPSRAGLFPPGTAPSSHFSWQNPELPYLLSRVIESQGLAFLRLQFLIRYNWIVIIDGPRVVLTANPLARVGEPWRASWTRLL
jgi:hypothetical protein